MHNEGMQVSPSLVKQNLRALLGGFISRHRLGQYLDFNVVVIPPGKHVTEFPTADAAFHPFVESEDDSEDAQLEIRLVPWLIVKISATEGLSHRLDEEVHNFWKAGVEEMWEICLWNRSVNIRRPREASRRISEDGAIGDCPVLGTFSTPVHAFFTHREEESVLPRAPKGDDSWRISQPVATGNRKLSKFKTPEFVQASDVQLQVAASVGMDDQAARPSGARILADALFHTFAGRMGLLLAGSMLATAMVLMILENSGEKEAPRYDASQKKRVVTPTEGARRELARATVNAFFKTGDIDSRVALVRHPELTRSRMDAYHQVHPLRSRTVRVFGDPEDLDIAGSRFVRLPTWVDTGSVDVFLEDRAQDGYRIDWESLVGYNPNDIDGFIADRETIGEKAFRVLASDGGFHGGKFASTDKFLSIVLNFSNSDRRLYGYVRFKSPLSLVLRDALKDRYKHPVRLRIRWPEEADFADDPEISESLITDADREMTQLLKDRQVWITALDGDSWFEPQTND